MDRPEALPPTTLAYIGDAVYELFVRERLLTDGGRRVRDLHRAATGFVRARAQAEALQEVEPSLTVSETEVVRRARNSHPRRVPRGSEQSEYRLSTAFEALVGYLHLKGESQRLSQVLNRALVHLAEVDEESPRR